MGLLRFAFKQILTALPLLLGVTLVAFLLMVYFGPDLSYELLSKNPSAEDLARVQQLLGQDQPFWSRYAEYLNQLLHFDFGLSFRKDQSVSSLLASGLPISIQLVLPGFVLGNGLAILLALWALKHHNHWPDRLIMGLASLGMSISFLVIIILFQWLFASASGLNWFPVRGWAVTDLQGHWQWSAYWQHVAVPTLATVFVTLGYNTRFYRAVLLEEMHQPHIQTAKAYGHKPSTIRRRHLLKNALVPIITRILFAIPLVVVSGALLLESYFGIPGVGLITYDAIMSGDQPVLKAVIGLTAVLFVLITQLTDVVNQWIDPRIGAPS